MVMTSVVFIHYCDLIGARYVRERGCCQHIVSTVFTNERRPCFSKLKTWSLYHLRDEARVSFGCLQSGTKGKPFLQRIPAAVVTHRKPCLLFSRRSAAHFQTASMRNPGRHCPQQEVIVESAGTQVESTIVALLPIIANGSMEYQFRQHTVARQKCFYP
jgi:hypothetical protein